MSIKSLDFGEQFQRLIMVLKPWFAVKPTFGTGTITRMSEETDNSGRVLGAYAAIDGNDEEQFVDLSMNQGVLRGDKLVFMKDENLINPEWRPFKIIRSRQPVTAPNPNRKFAPPVISGEDTMIAPGEGGIVAVPDTNPADDPTGVLQAAAYIHFLAISQDQYDAYDYGYIGVAFRYRVQGETDPGTGQQVDWKKEHYAQLNPRQVSYVTLSESVADNENVEFDITIPAQYTDKVLYNTACFWKVDNEIMLGYIENGDPTTFHVVTRGVLGTSAATHASGATLILLSARILIENLRPSTAAEDIVYQIQLAFVDNFGIQGMWSDTYSFTSYKITDPPAAPASLTVTITKDGYKLMWPKVPNQHVKQYRVYRYTSNPANGGGDANYASAQGMPGTSNARVGNVNQVNWPVDQYSGDGKAAKYFCVVAEDDTGNLSVATAWASDTTPPPSPDPTNVTIEATVEGPKIIIASADTSDRDEGFATWVLWQATSTAGASKTVVARFRDREFTYTADPAGTQYYQVTSEDLIGNVGSTTDNATYWKRDNGTPSAPAGLNVVALQGQFRITWTKPSYAQLKNIDYLIIQRSDNISSFSEHKIDKNADTHYWAMMDVPVAANVATYSYFAIGAYDYNGNFSGYSSFDQDTAAPASPSAANVLIVSGRGQVDIEISSAENPHLDDSWAEYVLLRATSNTGTGETIVQRFRGRTTAYTFNPYEEYYFQVVSADWVGNRGASVNANWVLAKSLYPNDPRTGAPMNGDFETIDPTNSAHPRFWEFTQQTLGTPFVAVGTKIWASMAYASTGGMLGTSCITGTLAGALGAIPALIYLFKSIVRFPITAHVTYNFSMYVYLPENLTGGQSAHIGMIAAYHADPTTTTKSASATVNCTLTGALTGSRWHKVTGTIGPVSSDAYVDLYWVGISGSGGYIPTTGLTWKIDNLNLAAV